MAISVTWQFFSHARNCLRSHVKVRNFRFLVSMCLCPAGASTHTVTLFLCTSMPQQRRRFSFTKCSFDRRAKELTGGETGKPQRFNEFGKIRVLSTASREHGKRVSQIGRA